MRHETAKALKTLIDESKTRTYIARDHGRSPVSINKALEALRVALTFEVQDDDHDGCHIDADARLEGQDPATLDHLLDYFADAALNPSEHHYVERAEIPEGSSWESNHTGDLTIVRSASLGSVSHRHLGEEIDCVISIDGFLENYSRIVLSTHPSETRWIHEGGYTGDELLIEAAARLLVDEADGREGNHILAIDDDAFHRAYDLLESVRGKITQFDKNRPEDNAGCLHFQDELDERSDAAAKAAATVLGVKVVDLDGEALWEATS